MMIAMLAATPVATLPATTGHGFVIGARGWDLEILWCAGTRETRGAGRQEASGHSRWAC